MCLGKNWMGDFSLLPFMLSPAPFTTDVWLLQSDSQSPKISLFTPSIKLGFHTLEMVVHIGPCQPGLSDP